MYPVKKRYNMNEITVTRTKRSISQEPSPSMQTPYTVIMDSIGPYFLWFLLFLPVFMQHHLASRQRFPRLVILVFHDAAADDDGSHRWIGSVCGPLVSLSNVLLLLASVQGKSPGRESRDQF